MTVPKEKMSWGMRIIMGCVVMLFAVPVLDQCGIAKEESAGWLALTDLIFFLIMLVSAAVMVLVQEFKPQRKPEISAGASPTAEGK